MLHREWDGNAPLRPSRNFLIHLNVSSFCRRRLCQHGAFPNSFSDFEVILDDFKIASDCYPRHAGWRRAAVHLSERS